MVKLYQSVGNMLVLDQVGDQPHLAGGNVQIPGRSLDEFL
jgi:hypothetical protein